MIEIGKPNKTWDSLFLYRELSCQHVLMVLLADFTLNLFIYLSLIIKAT